MKTLLLVATLVVGPAVLMAQQSDPRAVVPGHPDWRGQTLQSSPPPPGAETGGLDPVAIMKPLANEWTSYSGDLSGKRYSALKLVNKDTVKNLSLKWLNQLPTGCGATGTPPAPPAPPAAAGGRGGGGGGGGGGGRGGGGAGNPVIVTLADGSKLQGTLVRKDDWLVILTLPDGTRKSMARTPTMKIEVTDRTDAHKKMVMELDDPTNKKMHDVTAYLWTVK